MSLVTIRLSPVSCKLWGVLFTLTESELLQWSKLQMQKSKKSLAEKSVMSYGGYVIPTCIILWFLLVSYSHCSYEFMIPYSLLALGTLCCRLAGCSSTTRALIWGKYLCHSVILIPNPTSLISLIHTLPPFPPLPSPLSPSLAFSLLSTSPLLSFLSSLLFSIFDLPYVYHHQPLVPSSLSMIGLLQRTDELRPSTYTGASSH